MLKSLTHVDEGEIKHVLTDLEHEVGCQAVGGKLGADSHSFVLALMPLAQLIRGLSLRQRGGCEGHAFTITSWAFVSDARHARRVGRWRAGASA